MCARLLFTAVLILSACFSAAAQIETYQLSLRDSTQNILYVGCPNKVIITNLPSGAVVKFEDGYITPAGNNYIVKPSQPGNPKLYVYDKEKKAIFSKEFIASNVGDFTLQLGNVKYKIASVSDVLANPALVFNCSDCRSKPFFRVISYDIGLNANGVYTTKSLSAYDLTNVAFDKDLQDKIAGMKNGDQIFIENIKACGPDGTTRGLMPITVRIAFGKTGRQNRVKDILRDEIMVIVDGMAEDKILKGKGYGWLETLQDVATNDELIELTENENAVVKNYAFKALGSRKDVDLFPILMKHLRDTASVTTQSVDVQISWHTNEYIFLNVQPTGRRSQTYKMTPPQESLIDSILLFDSTVKFGMSDFILRYMKPDLKYYDRIRALAMREQHHIAVLLLAKYNNKNDVSLIKKSLESDQYYSVSAARAFPHESFYPFLQKKFEQEWVKPESYVYSYQWGVLFEALAQYPTKETYELFEKVVSLKDGSILQQLCWSLLVALVKYPHPLFEPIKEKIKLDANDQRRVTDYTDIETW